VCHAPVLFRIAFAIQPSKLCHFPFLIQQQPTQASTMKKPIAVGILLFSAALGFIPSTAPFVRTATPLHEGKKFREEIMHELEDLGAEIKPQLLHDVKGFEYTESTIHKLRHEIHERDVKYQKEIKALRQDIQEFTGTFATDHIKALREDIQALRVAYATDEVIISNETRVIKDYQQEHDSVTRLLGRAVKLTARRVRNFPKNVLWFLRLKKRKEE
jgi:hypothetical protein